MIDWASPLPDRDTALAKLKAEVRAEQRRLTDVEVDLIANVAIQLRMSRVSLPHRAVEVQPRPNIIESTLVLPKTGVDESSSRS